MRTDNLELFILSLGMGNGCIRTLLSFFQHNEYPFLGFLLCYVFLSSIAERMFIWADERIVHQFRTTHKGLQYCALLPLTLSLHYDSSFLISLVPITFVLYISQCDRSITGLLMGCIMSMCTVFHLQKLQYSELGVGIVMSLTYMVIVQYGPVVFQKSFSFGELTVVCQLYVYIMYCILTAVFTKQETSVIEKAVGVIFLMMNILIVTFSILKYCGVPTARIVAAAVLLLAVSVVGVVNLFLPLTEIAALIQHLFLSKILMILLVWWIFCTVVSICIVGYYGNSTKHLVKDGSEKVDKQTVFKQYTGKEENNSSENGKGHEKYTQLKGMKVSYKSSDLDHNTSNSSDLDTCKTYKNRRREVPMIVRKYFHVLILCVYVPGLVFNHQLLYVASSAVGALFILIETTRYLDIKPVSNFLNQYLLMFLDKQDQGDLILTPIYLLIGCSLPLWLFKPNTDKASQLLHYSGLISVGVGDAAASVFGRKFGQHKWPDSKKTVEGTIAAFLSQSIFLVFLNFAGVEDAQISIATVIVLLLISCLEAFTQHIDNLMVPVFAMMLFASINHVTFINR